MEILRAMKEKRFAKQTVKRLLKTRLAETNWDFEKLSIILFCRSISRPVIGEPLFL